MEQKLEFQGIRKEFPGVVALRDLNFSALGGRVLALMGENGAGKSTLLKILSGDLRADAGTVVLNGRVQDPSSPSEAIRAGISVIYQERQLIPAMSVMENIFAGALPRTKLRIVNYSEMKKAAQEIIDRFELPIDPLEPVGKLSVAYRQMVEVMKAYRRDSTVIAFDEPTASLTETEIAVLFKRIEELKRAGKIILYVSHRMAEVFRITDDIVVLKDGRFVRKFVTADTNEKELIHAMVGRDIGDTYANLNRNTVYGDAILEVDGLETKSVHDVSFRLRRGEILGFAGLVGAGRTEVARALFGLDPVLGGEIKLDGKPVCFKSPKEAIAQGIALCPEDRKEQGLVLNHSIKNNVSIPVLEKLLKGLFLNNAEEEALAGDAVEKYAIKTHSLEKKTMELSGGNQQKVILGRWTSYKMDTRVLILDEPTKGIDVGTKAEVYHMVCDFAKAGIGVIFISSELTEVINLADTVLVMRNGRIAGSVPREEATEEGILTLAMREEATA
ncbi:MAG: sugar ABC transporter ATP-binding protein [Clostridiales Family XIII bacterium]|nr:sugar ABC transporter ATP-binding protein [Clostridiales Family XIII bacterium]